MSVLLLCTILYMVLHKQISNDFFHDNEKNMSLPNWTYETSQSCLKMASGYSISSSYREANRNKCEDEVPICHTVCEKCVGEKDSWDPLMDHFEMSTYKIEPKGSLLLDTCHLQCNRKCNIDYLADISEDKQGEDNQSICSDWGWVYDDD